eukprot:g4810.t1
MPGRAPFEGSVQAGGIPEPTTPEELEEVQRLLAANKPWPAFLRAGMRARGEWNDCPESVREALEWMATAAVGLLDLASVGPLTPACKAFTALVEAAGGATEAADNLAELVLRCSFLVGVFIEHGKHVGDLAPVARPLDEFVSTTSDLAKRAKVLASRSGCAALLCHKKDVKTVAGFEHKLTRIWADIQGLSILDTRMILSRLEQTLRSRPAPVMADIPAAALTLPSSHVERADLLSGIVSRLTANDVAGAPYDLTRIVSEDARPRLVVLDDVWEREIVDTLQATGLQLLVTKRRTSVVAVEGGRTDVGNMNRREAREVLKKKSGAVALPESEADQVAEACGWHALTLAIAGSLRSVTDSPNSPSAWQKLHSEIKHKRTTARGLRMNADGSDDPTKQSLFRVLDLSLDSLGEDEQHLFLSLVVLARGVLAPTPMLASIWQKDHRGARKEAEFLVGNSLLQEVDGSFRLHDLLLDFITNKCQGEDILVEEAVARQTQYLGNLAVLRGYIEEGEFREGFYSLIGLWRKLFELCGNKQLEVDVYNANLEQLGEDQTEYASWTFWAVGQLFEFQVPSAYREISTIFLQREGKYDDAKLLYERSLAIREKVLGPDHPDVASILNNVALLLKSQGNYDDAKPLYERSLAIRERVLGPDHPDVASILNNVALLLESQGKYDDAKPLYECSFAIREKA